MNVYNLIGILLILFIDISLFGSEKKHFSVNTRQFELDIEGHTRKLEVEIHTYKQDILFIKQIESIIKEYAPRILQYFDYVPQDTVHVAVDPQMESGGQAAAWPRNSIIISPKPPLGQEYVNDSDWIKLLIVHELIHIIHIEQTHGLLQFLRYIIGSLGKMGGIVPRWFTEGLAVWGESFFLPEGRLNNPLLESELRRIFMDNDSCQTIDCLDDPGTYPYTRYPYWIGGYFLSFIEKNKQGSLSCIVKENSSSGPFRLNKAFSKCLDMNITESFTKFQNYYREKINSEQKNKHPPLQKLSFPVNGDWQGGMAYINGGFHYLEEDDFTLQMAITKQNSKEIIDDFSHRLDMIPSASPFSKKEGILPLAAYNSYKDSSRKWILWNSQSKNWEKIPLTSNPQYLFALSNEEYLLFNYHQHQWHISIQKNSKIKKIHSLPLLSSLKNPKVVKMDGNFVSIFKTYDANNDFKLLKINLPKGKAQLIYRSKIPFDFLGTCQNRYIIRKKKSLHLIRNGLEEKINAPWTKGVFFWDHYEKQNILLSSHHPQKILSYKGTCNKLLQSRRSSRAKNISLTGPIKKHNTSTPPLSSYPSFHHFLPHYWGVTYGGGDTLDFWNFFTSINDPMERHSFHLNYNYYPSIALGTPTGKYNYQNNKMDWELSYDKNYYKSSYTNYSYSFTETRGTALSLKFISGNWRFTPSIFYDFLNVRDFISRRRINHYGFTQSISRVSSTHDGFFQQIHLSSKIFRQETGNTSFQGTQTLFSTRFKWFKSFSSELTFTHGRLYKDQIRGGVIYGGGGNYYNSQSFHQFYGISYTDAYGNEISTGRFQLDILPFEVHRGWGMFPVFFKDIHLLLGMDYIESDYIATNNSIYSNENLASTHAGLRFQTTLAYMVPLSMDILYTKVHEKTFLNKENLIFVITGGLTL